MRSLAVVVALLAGLAIADAQQPGGAEVGFVERFEDADLAKRGWYDTRTFRIDEETKAEGRGAVRFDLPKGQEIDREATGGRRLFAASDSVYLRFRMKLSENWRWTGRPYGPHLMLFMTTENERYHGPARSRLTVYVEPCDGKLRLAAQDIQNADAPHGLTQGPLRGGYNGTMFDSEERLFDVGGWHLVEAEFRLNTLDAANDRPNADGVVRGWVDGRLVVDRADVVLRSTDYPNMKFNQFLMLPYFHHGAPHDQRLWIDDLAVAPERPEPEPAPASVMERVKVSADGKGFVLADSGAVFRPLGFNYDHDPRSRLIEDYWADEWATVESDFREMRAMGANVVRVHLQFGRFMDGPERANAGSLERLGKLLRVAESVGLRLDLTGLGCYHKADVPPWYDALDESARWKAQAVFWKAVAGVGATSGAVFCYDLMNEPVVPGGQRKPGDWLGPAFAGKHFVQVITLDQKNRPRPEIARAWVEQLAAAVREADPKGLVTVGLVDWSLDRPGLTSGFVPTAIAGPLDFLCVHLYPEAGKVDEAIDVLRGFASAGKLVVIEETFPLKAGKADFDTFLDRAQPIAAGLIGFYWGQTADELNPKASIGEAMTLGWYESFARIRKAEAQTLTPKP